MDRGRPTEPGRPGPGRVRPASCSRGPRASRGLPPAPGRHGPALFLVLLLLLHRPAAAAAPVHIEVALQAGGESEAVFAQLAADFHASHPGVIADLETDPRIADKLRVRILEKDFPEVTNANLGGLWNLTHHGDVADLSGPLAGPCWGPAAVPSWRASFLPGLLDRFAEDGHTYSVPLSYYAWTIWYDKRLFRARGWTVPRTWDELLRLCATIKATGLPPFAFQGRYPYYGQMFVDGAYYQLAGPAAFLDQKRLEPGTFDNPLMIQALTWTQTLATQFFQPGAMGMGHTEAQMQFLVGHAAMLPCGSWFKSEMAGKIPGDFELGTFNIPTVARPRGDPTALLSDSGYYTVFAHSKHPAEGAEFLRYLTSPTVAERFCRATDVPVATRGVNDVGLSPDLSDLVTLIHDSRATYGEAPGENYPAMAQTYADVLLETLSGRVTPARAAATLEAAARAERWEAIHPDDLPVRHVAKPVALLLLLAGGLAYAGWGAVRRKPTPGRGTPMRTLSAWHAAVFVGPAVLLFAAFALLPALKSFTWSVQRWDGLTDAHFVGLRHFRHLLFETDGFWIALANNLFIMIVIPLFMVPLALFLAACVSRGVRGGKLFRGAFLVPSVMGGVAGTLLWMNLYDPQAGIVNAGLVAIGRGLSAVGLATVGGWFRGFDGFAWLSQDHLYTALVPLSVWTGFGFNFVLYLAAMEAVPTELYEAANLDGASPWQQFHVVTLPLIWEVLTVSVVFLVIGGMKAFETIWLMTNQAPTTAVHVIGTRMIQTMFTEMNVGEATAIAVLLLAMVFVASLVAMRLMKREVVEL